MLNFAKGHGTRNDFVLVTDPEDEMPLGAEDVRFLCDRRGGIGNGVLRAVRARHIEGWEGDPDLWFMDYRNADGSLAEMCGNGVRVFTTYLVEEGLVPPTVERIDLGTRAGLRTAQIVGEGQVKVAMGRPSVGQQVRVQASGGEVLDGVAVDVGNPHAVVVLDEGTALDTLDLHVAPRVDPPTAFPTGVNVEFVERMAPRHVRMRVHERGVGETQSCGTGTVAVATALARTDGVSEGTWRVEVPGGTVDVNLAQGEAWLTGPAVIVAHGSVRLPAGSDA